MAGFNFGFFGKEEHRVFNYRPRYYDPEEEQRKKMFRAVDGSLDKEHIPGSSIRGAFRGGNYQKTRSSMGKVHGIITAVSALLIVAVLIYFTKFFELL